MLRRIDPLGPLFAVLGLGVFLIHGYGGVLTRDLSLYAYSGQQLADGVAPYVSVMNRAGPLAHVVPGLGALIADWLGTDDVLTQRVVMTILSMITVWLMYVIGRDLYRTKAAGAIAATTLLTIQGFMLYATGGPREKTTMVLMVTLAIWAILHRLWGWAGVFISLATLTWQPILLVSLAIVLAAVPWRRRHRESLRALVQVCLGGAIPVVITVAAFALAGALGPLVDGFLLVNLRYTRQTGLWQLLQDDPGTLVHGYGLSLGILLIGLIGTLVTALRQRRATADDPTLRLQLGLGVGVLVALAWSFKAFNGWPDLMFVIPLGVLGFTAVVLALVRRAPRQTLAVVACCTMALVLAGVDAYTLRSEALPVQRLVTREALRVAGPDATLVSVGGPTPLVLGHQTNPVRYQMFMDGFDEYVDDTYPGGLPGLTQHLAQVDATFISVDSPARYPWLRRLLSSRYTRVGDSAGIVWFARRSLGSSAIGELRTVFRENPIPVG